MARRMAVEKVAHKKTTAEALQAHAAALQAKGEALSDLAADCADVPLIFGSYYRGVVQFLHSVPPLQWLADAVLGRWGTLFCCKKLFSPKFILYRSAPLPQSHFLRSTRRPYTSGRPGSLTKGGAITCFSLIFVSLFF